MATYRKWVSTWAQYGHNFGGWDPVTRTDERANSLRRQCRGQDSNLHGDRSPRDFKSLASTDFATPASLSYPLTPHAARWPHDRHRRLATVRCLERGADFPRDLQLTRPSPPFPPLQQYQHRSPPPRPGEACAERAGSPRRRDHGIELRYAARVQTAAGFVRLGQKAAQALQVTAGEQRGAKAGARGLPHHVEGPRAQRLGKRALETGQPSGGPAGEPTQLRELPRRGGGRRPARCAGGPG